MATAVDKNGANDFVLPPRKKPKVSELPLSSAKRASIDGLLHTFKKKGDFDSIRKKTYAKFEDTVTPPTLEFASITLAPDSPPSTVQIHTCAIPPKLHRHRNRS